MKVITLTEAKQNLEAWLRKALKGEDIGVMIDGTIVALRPVKNGPYDYAQHEYGVSKKELDRFAQRMNQELDADRKAGHLKLFRRS